MTMLLAALLAAQFPYPVYRPPDPREPVTVARPIVRVKADYTPEARKARIAGVVIVRAGVEKDGTVGPVRVEKPLPFGLSEKAVEAVKKWKFKPCLDRLGRPERCSFWAAVAFNPP